MVDLELVIKDGTPMYTQEEIDAWWSEKQRSLPSSESAEPLLVRVDHALALNAIEEGRALLDDWEACEIMDVEMARTLRYYRSVLGQPEQALSAAWRVLDAVREDPWQRTSALLSVARFATQIGQYAVALTALDESKALVDGHTEWKLLGLARNTVEQACDLALAAAFDRGLAQQAFALAMGLADSMPPLPLVVLRKAADAAVVVGDAHRAAQYGALADAEERKIYGWRRIKPRQRGVTRRRL